MAAHYAHINEGRDTTIVLPKLIHIVRARDKIDVSACFPIDDTAEKIVGIIHKSSHYAVMEIDIKNRVSRIYDGLGVAPLLTWSQHILNALQMCQLIGRSVTITTLADKPESVQHPRTRNVSPKVNGYTMILGKEQWRLERGTFVAQTDGYNCGPIACVKVLEMYSLMSLADVKLAYSLNSLRKGVIDKWKRFIDYCDSNLVVRRRFDVTRMEEP